MSFLSGIVTSTGRADLSLDLPMTPQSSGAGGDAARSLREDNWENEGGHLAAARPTISSSAVLASDIDILEAQVSFMESALAGDFANGRIGMRYNSYAHRSRVLRQQQARLDALRAIFLAQEQPS